ncbi:MAG: helix-turn-helix domain-containing protein [Oscillospiraceae bacterium]|nr:helix-turn-helix domain-containing protein [Oscillospiraceae bacterium]
MKFNEKLQQLRKEKGMSQEGLAELLDVSRQTVSKWESGQSYPETEKMIALSEIFGVTLDSLIKDGEMKQDANNTCSEPFWMHRGSFYEYKSEQTWRGMPLVHINIGFGAKKAKGVIAIGNIANGVVAIGIASKGILSIGVASFGLISIGVASAGFIALGTVAAGILACGAIAIGIFTFGALSIGMFSVGALSVASHVAIGDHAHGHIAIGRVPTGEHVIEAERAFSQVTRTEVRALLDEVYPNLWNWIKTWIANMFRR